MNKIEVNVLSQGHSDPGGMMLFLARLTQRGHNIKDMEDLLTLYCKSMYPIDKYISQEQEDSRNELMKSIAALPHGTIQRFCPITVAIVGASRRFLAQARTHQVGLTYVSASLQYSDYTDAADFVVPYALMEADKVSETEEGGCVDGYLKSCEESMDCYKAISLITDNDTAGYAAPQGLRNILIMQGNHESWATFIRKRACNRNTVETQYVALRIWEALLRTKNGKELFAWLGPDCVDGSCREGSKSCYDPMDSNPSEIIRKKWPLL